jgi:hypothetical protein
MPITHPISSGKVARRKRGARRKWRRPVSGRDLTSFRWASLGTAITSIKKSQAMLCLIYWVKMRLLETTETKKILRGGFLNCNLGPRATLRSEPRSIAYASLRLSIYKRLSSALPRGRKFKGQPPILTLAANSSPTVKSPRTQSTLKSQQMEVKDALH